MVKILNYEFKNIGSNPIKRTNKTERNLKLPNFPLK